MASVWRRESESNEESVPFRLQLTQVQALKYLDFIGVQALFATARAPPGNARLLPFQRSFGEGLGEDLGETLSLPKRLPSRTKLRCPRRPQPQCVLDKEFRGLVRRQRTTVTP